ncbi:MAG: ABC transporter permease subunit [Myxococcota bacterium]
MTMLDPITRKRIERFKGVKRSYYALLILSTLYIISLGAELIANDKPLFISHNKRWYFPVFQTYKRADFGQNAQTQPDYKTLRKELTGNTTFITPPVWWGYNESNPHLQRYPAAPHADNWLGTDDRGRDVFVRLLYGFRISMTFALVTLFFALLLGTFVGGIQGFLGGAVDILGQRFVEMWVSLPYLFVIILVVNIFEPSMIVLIAVLASFSWMNASYYMRAECLRLKNQEFVLAAESLGAGPMRVFLSHIIPNAIAPMVTLAPFIMNLSVASLSFLDYMGLGVQPPTASIGELLKQGRENFLLAWWLAVYPFSVLVGTLVLINFVGEGVRKAFDPRASV